MMRDTNGRFELRGTCTNKDGRPQVNHIFILFQLGDETWWPSLYMAFKKNYTRFVFFSSLNLQCEFLNGDDDDVTCACG